MKKQINMIIITSIIFLLGISIFLMSKNQFLIYGSLIIVLWSILELIGNLLAVLIKNVNYRPIINLIISVLGLLILIFINYYLKIYVPESFNMTFTIIIIIIYIIFACVINIVIFYQKKQNILADDKNLSIKGMVKLAEEQDSEKVLAMSKAEREKYLAEYSKKLSLNPKYRSKLASKLTEEELKLHEQDLIDNKNK